MIKRIYIEITNTCNLNCSFCKKNERSSHFLTIQEFESILNKIENTCKYIYLHVQGEPLMHPELKKFIELSNQKEFNIQITTNGSLINKCDFLIDNIRKISFSLHSIPFQTITPSEYLNNILKFVNRCKTTYCELRFYNENNMDEKSKELLNMLQSEYNFSVTSKKRSYKLKNNLYIGFDDLFTWPSLNNPFVGNEGFCYGGLEMLAIHSNGNVCACCLDSNGDIIFGNIFENTMEEIINSDKYLNMINGFKNRKAVEQLCKHCSYRLRFNR